MKLKAQMYLTVTAFLCFSQVSIAEDGTPIAGKIDFAQLPDKGVRVAEDFVGTPDRCGILKRYMLAVPAFERGCYFVTSSTNQWPDGTNKVTGQIFIDSFD